MGDSPQSIEERKIQLGFSEPIESPDHVAHRSPNFNDWDGGQIGGRPNWLEPEHLPLVRPCEKCDTPMMFLCQLYAPVDDFDDGRAFHRSLYAFCCPTCDDIVGSIRILRAQLTRQNPYYPEDPAEEEVNWTDHLTSSHGVQTCAVCGVWAKQRCPLQELHFCSKAHQKEHKKRIFDKQKQGLVEDSLPSVYPMSELVVEEEPPATEDGDPERRETAFENNDDDSDEDLEQDDLNKMVSGDKAKTSEASEDPITMAFYSRIKDRPNVQEQCLRYCRWPEKELDAILWIKKRDRLLDSSTTGNDLPPPCQYCGAARQFEFQLLPQLLHYLQHQQEKESTKKSAAEEAKAERYKQVKDALEQTDSWVQQAPPEHVPPSLVDAKNAAIQRIHNDLMGTDGNGRHQLDWGTVAVYTCTASCSTSPDDSVASGLGAYREEFAWRQPSLDAATDKNHPQA